MAADDDRRQRPRRLRSVLDLAATVLVIVAAGGVITLTVRNWRQAAAHTTGRAAAPTLPMEPQSIEGAERIGSASAPVGMVIYSDFQCPFCAKFAGETWPSIRKDFVDTGRVLVVFRHLPLPTHNEAIGAALAADCAARQNRFWVYHDLLYQRQDELSLHAERAIASDAGLDLAQFDECMQHRRGDVRIAGDMESARSVKINSTPTFLIGRVRRDRTLDVTEVILGAQPASRFRAAFKRAATDTLSRE
jgi:protein-disulfide isomerase